jgi:hypothetical protein
MNNAELSVIHEQGSILPRSTKWCHKAMANRLHLGDFLSDILDNIIHIELLHWCEGAWHVLRINWSVS